MSVGCPGAWDRLRHMTATREGTSAPAKARYVSSEVSVTGVPQRVSPESTPPSSAWPLVESSLLPGDETAAPISVGSALAAISAEPERLGDVVVRQPAPPMPLFAEFESQRFLPTEPLPPQQGWRRAVWWLTHGLITLKPSRLEQRERELVARIQSRLTTCQRIAVASGKGGVGKTTATILCGTALATHRLDRIIAIDANPDVGSLGWRVERETEATLSDLIRYASRIERYSDVRALTSQAESRLEVLASELDPSISQALGENDFAKVLDVLEKFYSVVLCDLGTGLLDSATQGVLRMADDLVVVAAPSIDAGRVASFTLDFIERRYPDKAHNAVVLINNVRKDSLVDVRALQKHFSKRVRSVICIPYDRHLASGGELKWEMLGKPTRAAYTEAAAALAEGFATGR